MQVVWDGKRAVGVEFVQWDNPRLNGTVYARGEVVLSGGSINTPLLLTHSGIGPKHVLKKLGASSQLRRAQFLLLFCIHSIYKYSRKYIISIFLYYQLTNNFLLFDNPALLLMW